MDSECGDMGMCVCGWVCGCVGIWVWVWGYGCVGVEVKQESSPVINSNTTLGDIVIGWQWHYVKLHCLNPISGKCSKYCYWLTWDGSSHTNIPIKKEEKKDVTAPPHSKNVTFSALGCQNTFYIKYITCNLPRQMKFTPYLVNELLFKAVQMVLCFGSSIFMYFCTETSHSRFGNNFCHSPAKLDNNIFPTQNLSFTSILCPHEVSTLTLKY